MPIECLAKIRILLDTDAQAEALAHLANALRPVGSPWTAEAAGNAIEFDYRGDHTPENVNFVARVCADLETRICPHAGVGGGVYTRRRYAPGTEPPYAAPETKPTAQTYSLAEHTIRVDRWRRNGRYENTATWSRLAEEARHGDCDIETRAQVIYAAVLELFAAPYVRCKFLTTALGPYRNRDGFDMYVTLQIFGDPLDEADVGYAHFAAKQLAAPSMPTVWDRIRAWLNPRFVGSNKRLAGGG